MNDDVRAVLDGTRRHAVVCDDSEHALATFPAAAFGALITDPPSGITFMGAEWDHHKGGRAQWVAWLARILGLARVATRDGARALVWSLPRTSHWTGCAVEDAGWMIESEINHLFGVGFPKGKSQLKPAHEGWKLARNGVSVPLNIDDVRIQGTVQRGAGAVGFGVDRDDGYAVGTGREYQSSGRWPATVELSHTPWCVCVGTRRVQATTGETRTTALGSMNDDGWRPTSQKRPRAFNADPDGLETVAAWECAEGCPVLALDQESGERPGDRPSRPPSQNTTTGYGLAAQPFVTTGYADTGTAARFFAQHPAVDPDEPDPFVYATKVPAAERWCLARCGCGERVCLLDDARATCVTVDGAPSDDDAGNARAMRCTVCGRTRVHTVHPTQKSVALMRRFVRLVSRPGDVILDPFGGSMTTGVAALLEGRRVVLIERDPHFARIGRARLDATAPSPERLARVAMEPIVAKAKHDDLPLFGGPR